MTRTDTAALVDQVSSGGRLAGVDVSNDDDVHVSFFLSHVCMPISRPWSRTLVLIANRLNLAVKCISWNDITENPQNRGQSDNGQENNFSLFLSLFIALDCSKSKNCKIFLVLRLNFEKKIQKNRKLKKITPRFKKKMNQNNKLKVLNISIYYIIFHRF